MAELQSVIPLSPSMQAFVPVVRAYMRDMPELNRLVAGVESGDRFIAWSVLDAISRFNGTPHFTSLSLDDLLGLQQHHLLLRLTSETILESVGLLQTRNHINYSNGGINVGVNDKTPLIQSWLQLFSARTEQMISRVKVAINIQGILGPENNGVHSELWAVNSTYLSYAVPLFLFIKFVLMS
jgi:hypothetical protein